MTEEPSPRRLDRRAFLLAGGGLGVAGIGVLLAACGTTAPATSPSTSGQPTAASAAPTSSGAASTSAKPTGAAAGNVKSVLPTYVAFQLPFKADVPSPAPGIEDAWTKFPAAPFKSVQETPGTGSQVTLFSGTFWPPYTPPEQNPMLMELQKQLNITLNLAITNGADYPVKFNTLIAGGDLPDVVWVGPTPNLIDFLKNQCADLTKFLAGDAVKDYPNLAALTTNTWKGTIFDGAIMGLPSPFGPMGTNMQMNKSRWDAEIGAGVYAKDPDELKKMLQQLTRPEENKYAIASSITDPYGIDVGWFAMMFGAVNFWGVVNGKLTNYRETDAYKQSIAYLRDLQQLGVFHPKSATYDSIAAKADHAAGQFVFISSNAFYGNHVDMWNRGNALNPKVNFDLLPLVPPTAGAKPTYWFSDWIWPHNYLGPGIFAFKKASDDRIKELLRIWNWICSPFGSQERLLWEYGVEGTDWTRDASSGDIKFTQRGPADSTFVPIRFGPHGYDPLYNPGTPDYGPAMQKDETQMLPYGINDVSVGAYSNTDGQKGIPLNTAFHTVMTDIVAGRKQMSDFDQALKDWQSNGGDQIRGEYESTLAPTS
ncbi:MAG TPA: hypothetical protein VGJ60_34955 [Chloroflexota bacterium]|jgi:putative aldouronate transport system substrate-binding protein